MIEPTVAIGRTIVGRSAWDNPSYKVGPDDDFSSKPKRISRDSIPPNNPRPNVIPGVEADILKQVRELQQELHAKRPGGGPSDVVLPNIEIEGKTISDKVEPADFMFSIV